jgi:uncharacterized protein
MRRPIAALCIAAAVLAGGGAPSPALGQPTKDQLKERFRSRETELGQLKRQARLGETIEGYMDAAEADAAADEHIAQLIKAENEDRRSLYQILADEINKENPNAKVRATAETVASRNVVRNIEKAGPDERLRVAKDHWIRVRDYSRYQRLSALKAQGRVGETAAGLIEIIKPDPPDKAVEAVVRDENATRSAEYKALAEKEHVDSSVIAARMAKRNFENAHTGEMLKETDGRWRKK